MSDLCRDRLAIADRRLPPAFERRAVTIAPGAERPYDPGEWFDSLVMVQYGEVELVGRGGDLARFKRGDILWLTGLPLRALRNPGPDAAVLVAISRIRPLRPQPDVRFSAADHAVPWRACGSGS